MAEIRQFVKDNVLDKLDVTEEDVIDWMVRHKPRVILNTVAFVLQSLIIFWFMTGHEWQNRYLIVKLLVVLVIGTLMFATELIRFGDFFLKKYGYLGGKESDSTRMVRSVPQTKKPVSSFGSSSGLISNLSTTPSRSQTPAVSSSDSNKKSTPASTPSSAVPQSSAKPPTGAVPPPPPPPPPMPKGPPKNK